MKVKELKRIIDSLSVQDLENEVSVKIYGIYNTEPNVMIKSAYVGFDWSHGRFMLIPNKNLVIREVDLKP